MTIYLAIAVGLYGWTALSLVRDTAPLSYRDVLAAACGCAMVAAAWPLVLSWQLLLRAAPRG